MQQNDPGNLSPLCDEPRFAAILAGMVASCAPRRFAIVEEYGERVDGRIAAWGIAFHDRADIVSVEGGMRVGAQAAEDALVLFGSDHIRPRIIWVDPIVPD